jgi:hypothetical protein
MNLRVPQNVGKFLSSCTTSGSSKRAHFHEDSLDRLKSTGISEEHIASIFRVEEYAEQETSVKADGNQGWRQVPPKRRFAALCPRKYNSSTDMLSVKQSLLQYNLQEHHIGPSCPVFARHFRSCLVYATQS